MGKKERIKGCHIQTVMLGDEFYFITAGVRYESGKATARKAAKSILLIHKYTKNDEEPLE